MSEIIIPDIGSAYITKDGYFICHSCGKKADIFDIVMQIKGIGFSEATIFIAELSGGASHFNIENDQISKTTKEYQSMRLTPAEISALNIPPEINLKKLFFFDKEQYKKVVLERAKDRKQVYENMISEYGSRSSPKAYKIFTWIKELPCNTASIYAALSSELKTRIMITAPMIQCRISFPNRSFQRTRQLQIQALTTHMLISWLKCLKHIRLIL